MTQPRPDDAVAIHGRVGYLPGELALYPRLTGRQHLDRFARARGLCELSYCDKLVERFAAELDRPVRTLSKGNRQKIGLVLAFMHRPDLLVLDEPTSGLDPLLQDEFQTIVLVSVTTDFHGATDAVFGLALLLLTGAVERQSATSASSAPSNSTGFGSTSATPSPVSCTTPSPITSRPWPCRPRPGSSWLTQATRTARPRRSHSSSRKRHVR